MKIEITWLSLWRVFLMGVLAVGLFYVRNILALLFFAIIISSVLDTPLNYLEKKKIPRLLGILFIIIFVAAIIIIIAYTIIPLAIIEFKDLFSNFDKVGAALGGLFGISKITQNIEISLNTLANSIINGDYSVINFIPQFFENAIYMIALLITSLYLAYYKDGIENFLRAVLPLTYENYAVNVFHRTKKKIGKWFEGQIILSLIIAVLTFVGLAILGVNYSLVLGVVAGFFEIIPFVGPIVSGALAFAVAVSQSFNLGLATIILFLIIQQSESHLLVPIVMRKTTGIHPVIVVISILAGSQIAGFIGVILAIPFVVVVQELIEDYTARKYANQAVIR